MIVSYVVGIIGETFDIGTMYPVNTIDVAWHDEELLRTTMTCMDNLAGMPIS